MDNIENKQCSGNHENNGPCDRLLDAAEKLFCEKGYEGTSVRDLTTEAGCNIAAVNYHFGGKDKLYLEMFRRQVDRNIQGHLEVMKKVSEDPNSTFEDMLRGIAAPMIYAVTNDQPNGRIIKMLLREVISKRVETEKIVDDIKKNIFQQIANGVCKYHPEMDNATAQKLVFMIDALILHPLLFYDMYTALVPGITTDEIIELIVRFGAAALEGFKIQP